MRLFFSRGQGPNEHGIHNRTAHRQAAYLAQHATLPMIRRSLLTLFARQRRSAAAKRFANRYVMPRQVVTS